MTAYGRVPRWTVCLTLITTMMVAPWGCASVPRRYTWIAQPGVTLTMLSTTPQPNVGKVVLLGGTITEEEESDQVLMLRLKNRPLDQDYNPHRPADPVGPEAGSYWVMVPKKQVPPKFRNWARATVV